MTDEKTGPGDKRKPKATFGDVMQGIPSGDRERDRGERRDRGEKREAVTPEKRAKSGPMVVIKRAPAAAGTPEAAAEGQAATASAPGSAEGQPEAPAHKPDDTLYREVPEGQSFAEMFEEAEKGRGKDAGSAAARRMPRIGEKVIGRIFQLGKDTAFVTLGGRSEAMIDLNELKDEEGVLRLGVGDEVEAHVVQTGAKGIVLSRALGKGSASLGILTEARHTGMPVEGMVLAAKKGGLEVAIGDIRAFCPLSQIDTKFVEKPEQFVGEKLLFRVTEAEDRNIVLSRRAVLEQEQRKKAVELRRNLEVGKVFTGKVTNVRDFGAFVDIGGIEGMVPVSEMAHARVGHPSEVVKTDDDVEVEVIRIEPAQPSSPDKSKHKERITLSMRSRLEDPFKLAIAELSEGARATGKVVRLQPFGAFVELRPGVDGLIHISAMSDRRIAHPRDVLQVGQEIEVQIEKIDPSEKRIGLRLVKDGQPVGGGVATSEHREEAVKAEAQAPRPKAGMVVFGKVDRIEPFGVFVRFPGGKGLIPGAETGTQRGTDLKKVFSLDQEVKALILDIDPSGKIRLSITGAERAEERAQVEEWTKKQQPVGGGKKGFGTLGDLLKNIKPS